MIAVRMLDMTDSQPNQPAPAHTEVHHLHYAAPSAPPKNSLATASLTIGVIGLVLTLVPLFIGVFLGGILNILAFIFGIVGAVRSGTVGGLGKGAAITGIVLSCVAFVLMFFGAGTIW